MKRSRSRRNRHPRSGLVAESATSTGTDSDEQDDATYETDLTEPDDTPSPRKRHRLIETRSTSEQGVFDDAGELYDDPLDNTRIDLSEIPEDFDKAEGTIVRRERIKTRWKRFVTLAELHLSWPLLTKLIDTVLAKYT